MTNADILNHFAPNTVYKFNGRVEEFHQWQFGINTSYNYIMVDRTIYFVSESLVEDQRVTQLTEE